MGTEKLFTNFPNLETKRLSLREFKPEFKADIFKILSNTNGAVNCFLFTKIGTKRIEATTRLENIASARVLEKNGFQKEGTLRECEHYQGKSYDLVMYSILKREFLG
ncbi:MAG: N-acetyltransferase [Chloroflexi bacterium]|nr:MAG: N-acetyltransferase [Chloroflexota bacterium]